MSDQLTKVSNTSYISKDFQKIWPELLDLVKQLTTKWDPSVSDESDPGVILLKLNALLGDKLNYAIDKNTLECFPLSVTQIRNARQMYAQLGYNMRWYNAGVTNVSMSWIDTAVDGHCTIPEFTMVSDSDGEIVYTLLGPTNTTSTGQYVIKSQDLYFDNSNLAFTAMQGIALNYQINGETTITTANLDSNNRLYFDTTDVAQNGIFITNVDQHNYTEWEQKDNLLVEELNNKYYSFGVSQDTTACYIEFPEDAENIIRDGIQITYIKTKGSKGNIPANYLTKFVSDLSVTNSSTGDATTLTTTNIKIINYNSATDGTNPESIDSAYRNYKHLVGTFDTLVTLRDYINYILENNLASNGFVSDRTSDPQSCYGVISNIDGVSQTNTVIDKHIDLNTTITVYNDSGQQSGVGHPQNPCLTAYNIKFYLFNYVTDFSSYDNYNSSFAIMSDELASNVQAYLDNCRSVSHDPTAILETSLERCNICFIKNMYPIVAKVVTRYSLTTVQAEEVQKNIIANLYATLNSQQIDFRDSVSTDVIANAIIDADERIKTAYVDNIEYTSYAVLKEGTNEYNEYCVSDSIDDTDKLDINVFFNEDDRYDPTRTYTVGELCVYKSNGVDKRFKCITNTPAAGEPFTSYRWEEFPVIVPTSRDDEYGSFYRKFVDNLGFTDFQAYQVVFFEHEDGSTTWYPVGINTTAEALGFSVTSETTDTVDTIASISVNVSKAEQCKDEIFTKSVLSGVTPLYVNDEVVDYKFCQVRNFDSTLDPINPNINKIVTEVTIPIVRGSSDNTGEYTMRSNESIQLFSPNYISGSSYSNMVKYEYYINNDIKADEIYELRLGEYLVLYWKVEGDESEYYSYHVYSEGCVFKPSFNMNSCTETMECQSTEYGLDFTKLRNTGTEEHPSYEMDNTNEGSMLSGLNSAISQAAFAKSAHLLSGTKKITIEKLNQITINSSYKCYWMTNTTSSDGNNYILHFDENEKRTLDPGEYFIYSNTSLTTIVIFGAGTTITRNGYARTGLASQDDWSCTKLDLDKVLENGTTYISSSYGWFTIPSGITLDVIENKYTTLGSGSTVKLEPKLSSVTNWNVTFNKDGYEAWNTSTPSAPVAMTLADFVIQYKLSSEDDYTTLEAISSTSTSGWSARSLLGLVVSPDEEQILYSNQSIELYFNDQDSTVEINGSDLKTDKLTRPVTWNGTTTSSQEKYNNCYLVSTDVPSSIDNVDGYNMKYTNSSEGSTTSVTLVKSTNLIQDTTYPQMIHCKVDSTDYAILVTENIISTSLNLEKGTYFYKDSSVYTSNIEWLYASRSYYPVCLLSNESLSFDGGGEYQPMYLDENLEYVYPTMYISSRNVTSTDGLVRYLLDGAVALTFGEYEESIVSEATIRTYLPVGEYIIEFSNSGSSIFEGPVYVIVDKGTAEEEKLHTMYDDSSVDFMSTENTFLYWDNTVDSNHTFTITVPEMSENTMIILENPYRYNKPDIIDYFEFEKYKTLVKNLDTSGQFNYTFQVDEDSRIENPLKAASFLNTSHPYNSVTICEANKVSSSNIVILDKNV